MITSFQDLLKNRPPWSTVLLWYLRCMALLLIAGGVIHWARIVGFAPWRGAWFWEMPVEWQTATVFSGCWIWWRRSASGWRCPGERSCGCSGPSARLSCIRPFPTCSGGGL
ncbi:hypothetical protein V6L77_20460 [Pannonibacter sp. Pt2-lr]